jgi:hypothetical protein
LNTLTGLGIIVRKVVKRLLTSLGIATGTILAMDKFNFAMDKFNFMAIKWEEERIYSMVN